MFRTHIPKSGMEEDAIPVRIVIKLDANFIHKRCWILIPYPYDGEVRYRKINLNSVFDAYHIIKRHFHTLLYELERNLKVTEHSIEFKSDGVELGGCILTSNFRYQPDLNMVQCKEAIFKQFKAGFIKLVDLSDTRFDDYGLELDNEMIKHDGDIRVIVQRLFGENDVDLTMHRIFPQ